MEKFVVRGAAALSASRMDVNGRLLQKKRQKQMKILYGDKVVSEERVQYLKEELDDAKTTTNVLSVLEALEQVFMSLEMLEKTRIGISLTRTCRRVNDPEVQERAEKLLKLWKARAKKAMRRRARRVKTYGRNFAE